MTQKEVLGYNKLIAEFMGHKIDFGFKKQKVLFLKQHISLSDLKFHSNWNWLMEVVVKCKENCLKLKNVGFTQNSKTYNGLIKVDIDKVYQGCVEFIKWYYVFSQKTMTIKEK